MRCAGDCECTARLAGILNAAPPHRCSVTINHPPLIRLACLSRRRSGGCGDADYVLDSKVLPPGVQFLVLYLDVPRAEVPATVGNPGSGRPATGAGRWIAVLHANGHVVSDSEVAEIEKAEAAAAGATPLLASLLFSSPSAHCPARPPRRALPQPADRPLNLLETDTVEHLGTRGVVKRTLEQNGRGGVRCIEP